MKPNFIARLIFLCTPGLTMATPLPARELLPSVFLIDGGRLIVGLLIAALVLSTIVLVSLIMRLRRFWQAYRESDYTCNSERHRTVSLKLNSTQIGKILQYYKSRLPETTALAVIFSIFFQHSAAAQVRAKPGSGAILGETGVIITIVLIALPVLLALLLILVKADQVLRKAKIKFESREAEELAKYFSELPEKELDALEHRKAALEYRLSGRELSGSMSPEDKRGLIYFHENSGLPVVAAKKKAPPRPNIDPALSKVILWYIGSAIFWLLFGTTVGEYLGIKFIAPDADHLSWLSFGRLRPVHTNAVFWGWASLGMIGLGYYVVPRVGNTPLASIRWAWYALVLINLAVLTGSCSLMAGINNGGGEYREYVFPIMSLFVAGLALTLANYVKTIANRKTEEIYISNWYIVAALIFVAVIALVGYLPFWQNGLGETIVQGYYMHQAVGMWFMFFTLGIVYYFLPQQLNRPIYSYSLGILAFWTQILFYTLIGTHHFVFSAIPWWLQTVAIVASVGMVIPVVAGTTNFLLTFRGAWHHMRHSYTIPFFLVGILFYFTGSMQGTAEAFRFTNLLWHFTDFTVAHSHLTMYGIISFFLWAGMYALLPRITGKEAPQITIGIHFWLALIGLLFYTIPLMYGGTLRGLSWMAGEPFLESVKLMMPYWLWRAIGGTLMWLSHLFFAYNFYKMVNRRKGEADISELAIRNLEAAGNNQSKPTL